MMGCCRTWRRTEDNWRYRNPAGVCRAARLSCLQPCRAPTTCACAWAGLLRPAHARPRPPLPPFHSPFALDIS
ncbi:unnamed protein product [Nezara viridula]|uniref:Uncharacterized protein n=1 Tax=Nezara viridula TaxID=85310 RepID=A0A9P0HNF1_NEZVI|nr:unnamed protein product [Nezara viridula]